MELEHSSTTTTFSRSRPSDTLTCSAPRRPYTFQSTRRKSALGWYRHAFDVVEGHVQAPGQHRVDLGGEDHRLGAAWTCAEADVALGRLGRLGQIGVAGQDEAYRIVRDRRSQRDLSRDLLQLE